MLDALARSLALPGSVKEVGQELRQLAMVVKQLGGGASDPTVKGRALEVHQALMAHVT